MKLTQFESIIVRYVAGGQVHSLEFFGDNLELVESAEEMTLLNGAAHLGSVRLNCLIGWFGCNSSTRSKDAVADLTPRDVPVLHT